MIACLDVDYRGNQAVAACVLLKDWTDDHCADQIVTRVESIEAYEPGRFYKRELGPLLKVLSSAPARVGTVVIDGYVWLDAERSPGLGAYLYQALGKRARVIGVAKSRFKHAEFAYPVFRGNSRHPLYITAAGMSPKAAARCVRQMHGASRIPTILKKVDQLCRSV